MSWNRTLLVLTLGVSALVAVNAADEPAPNTGMADPVALARAFDRFAGVGEIGRASCRERV